MTAWTWYTSRRPPSHDRDDNGNESPAGAKADYVIDQGAGGTMIWELAGDYRWDATENGGSGQYVSGSTLTTLMYDEFKNATAFGATRSTIALPQQTLAPSPTGSPSGSPWPSPSPSPSSSPSGSPSSSPSSTPGTCTAPSWKADTIYPAKGVQVSWKGRTYTNKWWSLNEDPANSGQDGVWTDNGPC
ncbi:chitinase C-terminal domain-containing protein [Streptomyces sp. NPDC058401]|uniref:chitinase C-terminal domain-containing protein n=1 Tax=Streptomyces sp. NPDC058401 TaxID=3346480 RepID=UPI00365594E5